MKQFFQFAALLIICAACNNNKAIEYKTIDYNGLEMKIPTLLSLVRQDKELFRAESSNNQTLLIRPSLGETFDDFVASVPLNSKYNESYIEQNDTCVIVKSAKRLYVGYTIYMSKKIDDQCYFIMYIGTPGTSSDINMVKHIYNSIHLRTFQQINGEVSNADDFLNYTNALFSIKYPLEWKTIENPNAMSDVYIGDKKVGLMIIHFSSDLSLKEVNSEATNEARKNGIEITNDKLITIAKMKCYKSIHTIVVRGMKAKQVSYTFKKGDYVYNIKFGSEPRWINSNGELIDKIVNTFIIK